MSKKDMEITDHDLVIFKFLWRWKLATSSALSCRYANYFKTSSHTLYKRLNRLKEEGFLDVLRVFAPRPGFAWTLTDKSYAALKSFLPELIQSGYKSENPTHDLFVQAAHLGPYLEVNALSDNLKLVTEQELRRIHPDCLPVTLKKEGTHRADGYWIYDKGVTKKIVALEVETSRKSAERYRESILLYSLSHDIDAVVWIVESEKIINAISGELQTDRYSTTCKHHFILLQDFIENGWNARLVSSAKSDQKLMGLMNTCFGEKTWKTRGKSLEKNQVNCVLDTRLAPTVPSTCAATGEALRCD
ncbi:MAG: hypothetical protein R3A80_04255 [Bdellovibrionota bacterium]